MCADQVLIVGAGPTGLVLAMVLTLQNVRFRIISTASGPGTLSRAMAVHARTLEMYRPFGLAERALDEGVQTLDAQVRVPGADGRPNDVALMPFNRMGEGLSRYPFILQLAQDHHECMLVDKLTEFGVTIEWNTKLESVQQLASGVSALTAGPDGEDKRTYQYLVGADGVHSKVRQSIDVGFAGGTYEQPFFVADVKLEGHVDDNLVVTVDANTLCIRLPIRKTGMTRLIGLVPRTIQDKRTIVFEDVREAAERLVGVKVEEVNWFSPYHVHYRVAEKYRRGDIFIAGDACHVHSPLGGQGMNTGIGDAFNLGWKLSSVINGQASPEILDTYEAERRAFALQLVNTTDRAFSIIMQDNWWGSIVRTWIWPLAMSILTQFNFVKLAAFKAVSQIKISYPTSSLSTGSSSATKAGSRLPWVEYEPGRDNFAPLDGVHWQLHAYGDEKIDLEELDWIRLERFPFDERAQKAGLANGSVFFIRPDGYIGLAMSGYDHSKLQSYVSRLQLRP